MSSVAEVDEALESLQPPFWIRFRLEFFRWPQMAWLVVLLLAACGKATQSRPKTLRVGFAQIANEGPWRDANSKSIKDEARKRNIELHFFESDNVQLKGAEQQKDQIAALRSFISRRLDVIAFSPVVETGWTEVLAEAKEARIPVILMDRGIDEGDDSLFATFIGSDFTEEGRRAAQWLIRNFPVKERPINVVEIKGTVDSAPAIQRSKGFHEIEDRSGRIRNLGWETGNFTSKGAKEAMTALLKRFSDKQIDAVFVHSDTMALAAIDQLQRAGISAGKAIWIVSIDATKDGCKAIKEGTLNCSIECNALLGPHLFDAAEAVTKSMALPARTTVAEEIYDKTNVDENTIRRQP